MLFGPVLVVFCSLSFAKCFVLDDRTTSTQIPNTVSSQELLRILDRERYLRGHLETTVIGLTSRVTDLETAVTGLYHDLKNTTAIFAAKRDDKTGSKINETIESLKNDLLNLTDSMSQKHTLFANRLDDTEEKLRNLTISTERIDSDSKIKLSDVANRLADNENHLQNLSTSFAKQEIEMEKYFIDIGNQMENLNKTILKRQNVSIPVGVSSTTPVVAFRARIAKNRTLTLNETIAFTRTALNSGNGYNVPSGKFTAPVQGVYLFSVELCTNSQLYQPVVFRIIADGTVILSISQPRIPLLHTDDSSVSGTVIHSLKAADQVWVQSAYSSGGHPVLEDSSEFCWNQFSGTLIR